MRSSRVELVPPLFNRDLCFGQGLEPGFVQALIAEPAVEALREGVLHRLARLNELQLHAVLVRPLIEGEAPELRSVVADDRRRPAALRRQSVEHLADAGRWQRRITVIAKLSRVKSSTTVRARKVRPLPSVSCTKSIDHRSFACVTPTRGVRTTLTRLRRRFRTSSPSSR